MPDVEVRSATRRFSRRWILRSLLILGTVVAAIAWAWWRPAERFGYQEVGVDGFRVVTRNVGYFAPSNDKMHGILI
jgi:hypothetical protein